MTGTAALLDLAADLRKTAPRVRDMIDVRAGALLMERAAAEIERLAVHEPDLQAIPAEN